MILDIHIPLWAVLSVIYIFLIVKQNMEASMTAVISLCMLIFGAILVFFMEIETWQLLLSDILIAAVLGMLTSLIGPVLVDFYLSAKDWIKKVRKG